MRKLLCPLLFFVAFVSYGQITFEGVVKDSLDTPFESANVIAIDEETKNLESFGITDANGRYKLELAKNGKFQVQISYVGMKTRSEIIATAEIDITKDYILEPENALDGVEVVYEMPVKINGDTLVYNADSFNTGTERKLEDVLENLPGVEINEDGQVEVEGKVVNKLMVNGKDFFMETPN